jgi:hypothetical protein
MGLREGILYVQAESAAVIHYLTSFGKSDTIKKINVLMEKEYITDIRFKTGMVDERKRYTR